MILLKGLHSDITFYLLVSWKIEGKGKHEAPKGEIFKENKSE